MSTICIVPHPALQDLRGITQGADNSVHVLIGRRERIGIVWWRRRLWLAEHEASGRQKEFGDLHPAISWIADRHVAFPESDHAVRIQRMRELGLVPAYDEDED